MYLLRSSAYSDHAWCGLGYVLLGLLDRTYYFSHSPNILHHLVFRMHIPIVDHRSLSVISKILLVRNLSKEDYLQQTHIDSLLCRSLRKSPNSAVQIIFSLPTLMLRRSLPSFWYSRRPWFRQFLFR